MDYGNVQQMMGDLWHTMDYQVQSQAQSLAMREEEIAVLTSRLRKLEEDHVFNYQLIGERDAALEEASVQQQRLCRELRRLTEESTRMEARIEATEAELRASRQRTREVEAERETEVRQIQKEFLIKEQHLLETMRAKETALEGEKQQQHHSYMEQAKMLEEERLALQGRDLSVSQEAEARYRHQIERLQEEVEVLHLSLKSARESQSDAEQKRMALESQQRAAKQEADAALQRLDVVTVEASLKVKTLEERLVQNVAESEKRVAAAEAAMREYAGNSSRSEMERTRLQSMLAEAQERLQHLTSRYEEDVQRYVKERQTLLATSDAASAATVEAEEKLRAVERELEKQRRAVTDEVARAQRQIDKSDDEKAAALRQVSESKEACGRLENKVELLEAEVKRWREEEQKTANSIRAERSAWEEKLRLTEYQLQTLKDATSEQKRRTQESLERAQSEAMRLERELHASNAARRALEDQLHLDDDRQSQLHLIRALQMEKSQLQQRISDLEHTNSEVQQQVANFTLELQNDPVIKAAKETQHRVVELQQELLDSKAAQQELHNALKEKEEEAARHQADMLRVQLLTEEMSSSPLEGPPYIVAGRPTLSDRVSHALRRQHQQMRTEYTQMRQSYEEMLKELNRQHRRQTRRRKSSATRTVSSTVSASSSRSSSKSSRRHRRRTRSAEHPAKVAEPLPVSTPSPSTARTTHLLQEAEVLRHRCSQLEEHVRGLLRERDRLKRELHLSNQDAAALLSEKQSLIDMNALLKAQLRDAFHMRVEEAAAPPPVPLPARSHGDRNATTSKKWPSSITPEMLASAIELLQQSQDGEFRAVEPGLRRTSSAGRGMRTDDTTLRGAAGASRSSLGVVGATSHSGILDPRLPPYTTRHTSSSLPGGTTGMLHTSKRVKKNPAMNASSQSPPQDPEELLSALDEDISSVRDQIRSTLHERQPQRTTHNVDERHGYTGDSASEPADDTLVFRRGGSAVRHYGYP